ncbi:hypothetical protein D9M72_357520 [compost metagenome]
MLACLVALAHGTGLTELCGEFGGGIRRRLSLLELSDGFPCGDGLDPGATGFCGKLQGAERRNELRLTEPCVGDGDGLVAGQKCQDVCGNQALDCAVGFEFRRADPGRADRYRRIEEQSRLPGVRRGIAKIGVGRLKTLVVEKRDLNGGIGVDRFALQERLDLGIDLVRLFSVLDPDAFLGRSCRNLRIHRRKASVPGRIFGVGRAAGEHERQADERCQLDLAAHHDASPFLGDWASFNGPHGFGPIGSRWV